MADLFGEWVPDEWIIEVMEACRKAPQHRYLFLTKNPLRYDQLEDAGIITEKDMNFWLGSTTTDINQDFMHWDLEHPNCGECPQGGPGFGFACRDDLLKGHGYF